VHNLNWTDIQRRRLKALNAPPNTLNDRFETANGRNRAFQVIEKQLVRQERERLAAFLTDRLRPRLCVLESRLIKTLNQHGFAQVTTPAIISLNDLERMSVGKNHPLSGNFMADDLCAPVTIAVMRLIFPGSLIPASSDVDGPDGLRQRLQAGANVVTSLIPPGKGFTGVVSRTPDIDNARRMPQSIAPILKRCALEAASTEDYMGWIETRRSQNEFQLFE